MPIYRWLCLGILANVKHAGVVMIGDRALGYDDLLLSSPGSTQLTILGVLVMVPTVLYPMSLLLLQLLDSLVMRHCVWLRI